MENSQNNIRRVVLTGGPGAGKTTAADLLRREIGEQIIIVPEAATMIFSSGFPRYKDIEAQKSTQATIYQIQKSLENIQAAQYPERTLLCDRGTLDSAVYWPDGKDHFFKTMNTSMENELKRYDAVIFFETAAAGQKPIIEGGNPTRNESLDEAINLDKALQELWSQHPHYFFIPHHNSFIDKIMAAVQCIQKVIC